MDNQHAQFNVQQLTTRWGVSRQRVHQYMDAHRKTPLKPSGKFKGNYIFTLQTVLDFEQANPHLFT